MSGCSESSCSSIDEYDISDTDDPDLRQAIKPMAAYGVKKSKSGTLTSIKSVKISKSDKNSRRDSIKKTLRKNQRPSVCNGLFGVMGVAIKVNTPADAGKVCLLCLTYLGSDITISFLVRSLFLKITSVWDTRKLGYWTF